MASLDVPDGLRRVVFGVDDQRVRATWRVLLAMPLLWVLTGDVLTGNLRSAVGFIPSGQTLGSGLAASVLHVGFLLVALVPWARYLDRQPLSSYGISASLDWARAFLIGFVAVVVGQALWIGFSSMLPGRSVALSPSTPEGSVLVWLVLPFGALVLHAAVQQVVFFRVILENAAQGLYSRGVTARRATTLAVPVAVVFFVAMHGSSAPLRVLDLAVAGGVFGLLYLHTGELGLGIGAHFGAFYSGTVVLAVVKVTGSLSGVAGEIGQLGLPKMALAYLVVLGWLRVRHGRIPVRDSIARWDGG